MYNLLYVGKLAEEAILTVIHFLQNITFLYDITPFAILIHGHAYTVILSANRRSRLANSTGRLVTKTSCKKRKYVKLK